MKRNDLRAMGLTPDQIDTIMTMNGADINREKANRSYVVFPMAGN